MLQDNAAKKRSRVSQKTKQTKKYKNVDRVLGDKIYNVDINAKGSGMDERWSASIGTASERAGMIKAFFLIRKCNRDITDAS